MYTALRTFCPLRPTRFDCEAMTFPEMTVRPWMRFYYALKSQEEGRRVTQRATFKRARRGYGRDKRGPPAQWVRPRQARPSQLEKNRNKGVNGEWAAFWHLA